MISTCDTPPAGIESMGNRKGRHQWHTYHQLVVVLEMPPVVSAETTVVQIVNDVKAKK